MAHPQAQGSETQTPTPQPYSLHLDQPERKQLMPEITEPPTIESSVLQLLDIISELITRVEALESK